MITEPGVYQLTDADYFTDPVPGGSLSASGAKKLLPPNCPARFAYDREHGTPPKREFTFGHAAHLKVLGAGADLVVIDAANYMTKAAKAARDEAYEAGLIPVLTHEAETVDAMAAAIQAHPFAPLLLAAGKPEQSMFWEDHTNGIWRRARIDWLPDPSPRRLILADYKTCNAADDESCAKAIFNYGYASQADWYLSGAAALGLGADAAFLFIFQEKTAPYLVNVVGCDETMLAYGRARNDEAIAIYSKCTADGVWPGYGGDDITYVSLPNWVERRFLEGQL